MLNARGATVLARLESSGVVDVSSQDSRTRRATSIRVGGRGAGLASDAVGAAVSLFQKSRDQSQLAESLSRLVLAETELTVA